MPLGKLRYSMDVRSLIVDPIRLAVEERKQACDCRAMLCAQLIGLGALIQQALVIQQRITKNPSLKRYPRMIERLSDEIWLEVILLLPVAARLRISAVCSRFRSIMTTHRHIIWRFLAFDSGHDLRLLRRELTALMDLHLSKRFFSTGPVESICLSDSMQYQNYIIPTPSRRVSIDHSSNIRPIPLDKAVDSNSTMQSTSQSDDERSDATSIVRQQVNKFAEIDEFKKTWLSFLQAYCRRSVRSFSIKLHTAPIDNVIAPTLCLADDYIIDLVIDKLISCCSNITSLELDMSYHVSRVHPKLLKNFPGLENLQIRGVEGIDSYELEKCGIRWPRLKYVSIAAAPSCFGDMFHPAVGEYDLGKKELIVLADGGVGPTRPHEIITWEDKVDNLVFGLIEMFRRCTEIERVHFEGFDCLNDRVIRDVLIPSLKTMREHNVSVVSRLREVVITRRGNELAELSLDGLEELASFLRSASMCLDRVVLNDALDTTCVTFDRFVL